MSLVPRATSAPRRCSLCSAIDRRWMWIAGVAQGLMWRATNTDGTLTYSFAQSVNAMYPFYTIRLIGGAMFFSGMLIMAYNVFMTSRRDVAPQPIPATASAA